MIRQNGFTLPEMMVTVAILAILSAAAVPAIRNIQSNVRISATANELAATLTDARARALATRRTIAVTSVTTASWASGWQTKFQTPQAADPTYLVKAAAATGTTSIASNPTDKTVLFQGTGLVTKADGTLMNMAFVVCDAAKTGERGITVQINQFGRVVVLRHTSAATCS
ncbi:MAG TPA: GspH/FimT family pseudopilin [Fluviicoccus sp.]|nr:GspH/FimT family pseudopilin [Fluviicoccus sp.]